MWLSLFRVNRLQHYRHFALLDTHGRCIAFKSCEGIPQNGKWVQVNEINLVWLNRALPARALAKSITQPL
ncbi:hypothetical protein SAMN05216598_4820 [Pseudomonas asplenii]|uniref:Uncharacterized protein n=1 Tax=Pseudomonas asplenii TaxID=53407 RepID=A0A1H1Z4H9_9PSED|nr:hypothetical protein [Pseudomonas asplenii]SDT28462.1 hypothetical protein SAMN05216598_4820 [Pseudomonas asplenii]